ncbi:MAG: hypothetical protein ABW185_22505 [Sedimenticola sp.]
MTAYVSDASIMGKSETAVSGNVDQVNYTAGSWTHSLDSSISVTAYFSDASIMGLQRRARVHC